jgi:hypothetical protein
MAALETPGAVTPFGSATSAQEALSEAAGLAGKDLGRVRKALETEGVTGPNAIALADQLRAKGDELMLTEANKAIPRMYFRAADRIKEMAIAGEERGGPLGRLGLEQAEKAKSSYQKLAEPAYERLKGPEAAKVNADIARRVRLANEIAVADAARKAGPGSAVADLNKEFIPAKRQFGNLAKAMAASQRGAARESQRQGGGLLQTAAKLGAVGMAGGAGAVAGELGMGAAKRFGTGAAASGAHRLADVLRSGSMAPGLAQGGIQLTQDEMQRLTDYLMGGK